jgi:hypothetical protein
MTTFLAGPRRPATLLGLLPRLLPLLMIPAWLVASPARAASGLPSPEVFGAWARAAAPASEGGKETQCSDGQDEDGDLVFDCADADCKSDPACAADGQRENTDPRCSDWVDNDDDGYVDCDDYDCDDVAICRGSWDVKGPATPVAPGVGGSTAGAGGASTGGSGAAIPELKPGQTEADLIGTAGDANGERNNVSCSDGIDNDADGQVDCADLGCKLDTEVSVCQGSGDFRFSVVARVAQTFQIENDPEKEVDSMGNVIDDDFERFDTEFETLQLRVLGQMPFIQNSFFLLSMRAEKTPRLTFALFQVPLGKKGHYFNLNSGGGGLSLELVRSVSKRLLTDPAFYVYNAFEQGNGAAAEFGGPFDKRGRFLFRTFLAGGSGRFSGNIGGRFLPDGDTSYTWSVGGQVWINAIGYYTRWDSPFLYTPAPLTLAFAVGAKFDQRPQERYPAANVQAIFKWKRIILLAENYTKREIEFKNWQTAYNVQLGVLAWNKRLMLAGDFGQYLATDFEDPPEMPGTDLRRQLRELQYRAAAHVYLWRDVFFATVIWRDRRLEPTEPRVGIQVAQDIRLLLTYRF